MYRIVVYPFGYSGEYVDSESGNVYLRNRYYDSSIGRFITEDPAQDGLNWYVYAGNNPVSFVDPWGLETLGLLLDEGQPRIIGNVRYNEYGLYGNLRNIVQMAGGRDLYTHLDDGRFYVNIDIDKGNDLYRIRLRFDGK